ncbi:MAG: FmdB family zinc ribbon protein [Minisyncoccia bacterium]
MPRYEYSCEECNLSVEISKPFSESDSYELCQHCGNKMSKIYGTIGIQFKGSGFYKTDNAK